MGGGELGYSGGGGDGGNGSGSGDGRHRPRLRERGRGRESACGALCLPSFHIFPLQHVPIILQCLARALTCRCGRQSIFRGSPIMDQLHAGRPDRSRSLLAYLPSLCYLVGSLSPSTPPINTHQHPARPSKTILDPWCIHPKSFQYIPRPA